MKRILIPWTLVLALGVAGCHPRGTAQAPVFKDFDSAYGHLVSTHPELEGWISDEGKVDLVLHADASTKRMFFLSESGRDSIPFVNAGNRSSKQCADEDASRLERLLERHFSLKSEEAGQKSAKDLCETIHAQIDSTYLKDIEKAGLKWTDKVLSILYNVCVGDPDRHVLVAGRGGQIQVLRETDLPLALLDKDAFVQVVNQNKGVFTSPHAMDSILRAGKALVSVGDIPAKARFAYLNVRKDRIYIGGDEHRFKDQGVEALHDSLETYPESVFFFDKDNQVSRLSPLDSILLSLPSCRVDTGKVQGTAWEADGANGNDENKEEKNRWWLFLILGACLGGLSVAAAWLIMKLQNDKKEDPMKTIELVQQLIDEYKYADPVDEQKVRDLVYLLNRTCPDFNDDFQSAEDLEAWLEQYKKKHQVKLKVKSASISSPRKTPDQTEVEEEARKKETLFSSLNKIAKNRSPRIYDILSVFDAVFAPKKPLTGNFEQIEKKAESADAYLEDIGKITECKTEKNLLDGLDDLRKKYPGIPKVDTVSSLYQEAVQAEEKDSKRIEHVLKRVEAYADGNDGGHPLSLPQSTFIRRAVSYDKAKKLLGLKTDQDVYEYIRSAMDKFRQEGQDIDAAVRFVSKFKPDDAEVAFASPEEILGTYPEIKDRLKNFEGLVGDKLGKKEELDFWDRMALVVWSVSKCAVPLLDATGKSGSLENQCERIVQDVKNDLLLSYVTRYFLRDAKNTGVNGEQFASNVKRKLPEFLEKYNKTVVLDEATASIPDIPQQIDERIDLFAKAIGDIRGFEAALPFVDRMWDYMGKGFRDHAKQSGDEAYIIAQALNIAFHTVDFLDHLKGGRDVEYCYNYAFLLNDFDERKTGCKEFKFNDYSKSTEFSNFIFQLADRLGIEHLKILVDNFFIKP